MPWTTLAPRSLRRATAHRYRHLLRSVCRRARSSRIADSDTRESRNLPPLHCPPAELQRAPSVDTLYAPSHMLLIRYVHPATTSQQECPRLPQSDEPASSASQRLPALRQVAFFCSLAASRGPIPLET